MSGMDQASPGGAGAVPTSKLVGPGHAETVHASEKFDKAGLLAAHLAALHDAYMLERGLLPGTSLPDSEAPPIPPVYAESPWKDFKLLSLSEMKVGKTHRRHALEGTLCAKSLKVTSVVNVLEEDSGLATKLILTNALHVRASMAQAQNCYPQGSRVTVRDPYLTRFPDGVVGVLVERPNDIAFLSRPESTGDNGHMIYGAVGFEDDERTLNPNHEDFSRKIHLFEQQMKQEQQAQQESLESRRMSGMFQRPVAREEHVHRSSPPKAEAVSPVKEELKEVISEQPVVDRSPSPTVESVEEPTPPTPIDVVVDEPDYEVIVKEDLPVEEPTTPKAEERRTEVKDIEEEPAEAALPEAPEPDNDVEDVVKEVEKEPVKEEVESIADEPEVVPVATAPTPEVNIRFILCSAHLICIPITTTIKHERLCLL